MFLPIARICVDFHSSCYHQMRCDCLGSEISLGFMLESGDFATNGPMLIWEACTTIQTTVASRPKLMLMAMIQSVVPLQLGSVLMSVPCVTTEAHASHMRNYMMDHLLKYKGLAELAPPITLPGIVDLDDPGLGRLTPPLTTLAAQIWGTL